MHFHENCLTITAKERTNKKTHQTALKEKTTLIHYQ